MAIPEPFGHSSAEREPQRGMSLKVEPVLFVFMLAYGVTIPLRTEYLKDRFVTEAGLDVKDESADCHVNKSSAIYPVLKGINDKTAYWSVYLAFMISLPALFSSNYLCAISDHRGRKLPMFVTTLGFTIYCLLHMVVIAFSLSLHLLAIASFILGCCGDFITMMSSGFAYVADTTTLSSRVWRIVVAETLITFAASPGQIGAGYLIDASGFEAPYIFMLVCMLISSLYLYYLPESVVFDEEMKGKSRYNPREVLVDIRKLLSPNRDGRLWKLLSYNAIIFVYIMNAFGFIGTSVLYVTSGNPFCFSYQEVGFYEAAQFLSAATGMFVGGALLPIFISDLSVIHLSNIFFIVNLVLTGIVTTKTGLYAEVGITGESPILVDPLATKTSKLLTTWRHSFTLHVIPPPVYYDDIIFIKFQLATTLFGLVRLLAVPLARARMSKLVHPSEQGVMFALSGCVQSLATMIGIPVLQAIFPPTNAIYPGLIFIIMAAFVVPPEVLTVFLHIDDVRSKQPYRALSSNDEDEPGNAASTQHK